MAAPYMLWLASTATTASTLTATAAMASPLPARFPRMQPTRPAMASAAPTSATKNETLLMMGINDVSNAMTPTTSPAIASPGRCGFSTDVSICMTLPTCAAP